MKTKLIAAHNPGPYTGTGNNTYLILGREPALIDAGTGEPRHLQELADALGSRADGRQSGTTLMRLLVTHAHADHASGTSAIAARWPRVTPLKMPCPDLDVKYPASWQPLADGDLIPAGDAELRVIHTPGHSPDHICFFEERSAVLFSGDLVVSGGTVMIPASAGGDLASYLESLRRVSALKPSRLLPAHGPAIEEPELIVRQYLEHRQHREEQVMAALNAGLQTVDLIVSRVYEDLVPDLRGAARESVLAHLEKLESEGRVVRADDKWYGTGDR